MKDKEKFHFKSKPIGKGNACHPLAYAEIIEEDMGCEFRQWYSENGYKIKDNVKIGWESWKAACKWTLSKGAKR